MSNTVENIPSVSIFLDAAIVASGRSIAEIAEDAGYKSPEMLRLFIENRAKIPIDHAPRLARAIGCRGPELFRLVLRQFLDRQTWAEVEQYSVYSS